jgi:hypothetical protein
MAWMHATGRIRQLEGRFIRSLSLCLLSLCSSAEYLTRSITALLRTNHIEFEPYRLPTEQINAFLSEEGGDTEVLIRDSSGVSAAIAELQVLDAESSPLQADGLV